MPILWVVLLAAVNDRRRFLNDCCSGMSIEQRPKIAAKELVNSANMGFQQGIRGHAGAKITIIHAVQRIQLQSIALEVSRQECAANAEPIFSFCLFSLTSFRIPRCAGYPSRRGGNIEICR